MKREFVIERSQVIARPVEEVFEFFSDADNLAAITPGWLRFDIVTPAPIEMAVGTLIDYRIRLHGIPMRWRSVITAWDPPNRFVDEQVRGPYRRWVHEHTFEPDGASRTIIRDRVRYHVPGGTLAHKLFVEPDLERVFTYRARKLDEIFHAAPAASP